MTDGPDFKAFRAEQPEAYAEFRRAGMGLLSIVASGPTRWEKLPTHIKPELIGSYIELMARGASNDATFVDNLRKTSHAIVAMLCDELEDWAVANNRPDLVEPIAARVTRSILEGDNGGMEP